MRFVSALVALLLMPLVAWATPAFDGASNGMSSAVTTTLTISHTVTSNANGLLTVCAGSAGVAGFATGITYNGVALTKAGEISINAQRFVGLWYLKLPATGTNNIVITYAALNNNGVIGGGGVSFTAVDQTTPVSNVATASGTSTSSSVTVTSPSGAMVNDCEWDQNGAVAPTSGATQRWSQVDGTWTSDGNGSATSTAVNPTMTWTWNGSSTPWLAVGMSLNAVSAVTRHRVISGQ